MTRFVSLSFQEFRFFFFTTDDKHVEAEAGKSKLFCLLFSMSFPVTAVEHFLEKKKEASIWGVINTTF